MSIKVIAAVLQLSPAAVTPTERLVLCVLAWHADEHGQNVWPATATIARESSLTRRAIQKILPRLQSQGFIVPVGRAARGQVRYAIALAALEEAQYVRPARLDCEPRSQTPPDDCEPRSQSELLIAVGDREPRSPECEPDSQRGRTPFAVTANRVHPIRPVTVIEPSLNKCSDVANAPSAPARLTTEEREESYRRIRQLAAEIVEAHPPDRTFEQLRPELEQRAANARIPYDAAMQCAVLAAAQNRWRLHRPPMALAPGNRRDTRRGDEGDAKERV